MCFSELGFGSFDAKYSGMLTERCLPDSPGNPIPFTAWRSWCDRTIDALQFRKDDPRNSAIVDAECPYRSRVNRCVFADDDQIVADVDL
jgi:hypothetical protein